MALPFEADALNPVISRETIDFHHGKHLAAYVNNLNALLPGSGFEEATLIEIVCKATGGILNNAGQILNHELYFGQFSGKPAKTEPTGKLAEAIELKLQEILDPLFEELKKVESRITTLYSVPVGYGSPLIKRENSSSPRKQMLPIPYRKV